MKMLFLTADSADNADIGRRMGAPAPSPESLSRRFLFFAEEIQLEKGFSPFNTWTAQEHHPTFFANSPS